MSKRRKREGSAEWGGIEPRERFRRTSAEVGNEEAAEPVLNSSVELHYLTGLMRTGCEVDGVCQPSCYKASFWRFVVKKVFL